MFVELCLVLRILLNEGGHIVSKNVSSFPCEAAGETPEGFSTTENTQKENSISVTQDGNANLKPLWVDAPIPRETQSAGKDVLREVEDKEPLALTKITKTLSHGLEPFFNKAFFEPFERRPKTVTLVAFKNNVLHPRLSVKTSDVKSEVAELQSPFNDVGHIWMNVQMDN